MKVLHLTSQDNSGAGRAAVRLHQALQMNGIHSQMIVQHKITDIPDIISIGQTKIQKFLTPFYQAFDQAPVLFYKKREEDIFSSTFFPSNKTLIQKIKEINPDIIHLHWINFGFVNIFDLTKLNKPIFWSLHDANTYTGGCHVVYQRCEKYKTFCHSCPFLQSNFKYDLSYLNFQRKRKAYDKVELTINGLSQWIASEARSSSLLHNKTILNLPNVIDTNVFSPIKKNTARKILKLTTKKILIGFGGISGTQIERKGYAQLKKALEILPDKHFYKLVVFGSRYGEQIAGIDTIFLGHLFDDISLALLYSSLDIFITPSLAENLSNSIMESLSCGTPVLAFDIGGNSDLITHKRNGYLAQNIEDLKNGILWLLQNYRDISNFARTSVVHKFNPSVIATKYIQAYRKLR